MHADLKYVESLEDELDELESDKAEFSNMYDMLLQECVSKYVMCSYLQSSSDLDEITELQCLYLHKVRECDYWRSDISEIYMVLLVSCWRTKLLTGNSGTDLYNFLQEYIVHQLPICSHENEKLHKENTYLKQTYKDLYDFIKKTRVQTKDLNDSLIAQVNSKTVENADLKAQIQEKVFVNATLKNELRKLKGNSVDTKFAKSSILGKPFASQVNVKHDLPKPLTPYYSPKVRESVFANPHHMIAPGSSRNSSKESYGSNEMTHNYYLEEAKKKTHDRNRNLKPKEMPSARTH
ncbi:hypothetical protein Tco_0359878 [Tanacetum coccineum]